MLTEEEKDQHIPKRPSLSLTTEDRLRMALSLLVKRVRDYAESGCIECYSYIAEETRHKMPSLSDVMETAEEALK